MDFKTFINAAEKVAKANFPVMIRGAHGIGKSEVVYQIADRMGLPVVERRASQMTEGDLIGMPKVDGNVTSWLPPEFYHKACLQPVVLFLDELDRALPEVRQGFFELADSRKLSGYKLHEGTRLFAAVNGGVNGKHYQVFEMGPAENDRWWIADVEPTHDDWLTWAKDKVHPFIWDFINNHTEYLDHSGEFDPVTIYPSRRSWKRLSDAAVKNDLLTDENFDTFYYVSLGFVGAEAASELQNFKKNYSFNVTVEELLAGSRSTREKLEKFDQQDHMALIRKFRASEVLLERILTEDECENLNFWLNCLPDELVLILIQVFAIQPKYPENIINFHGAGEHGRDLGSIIVRICNEDSANDLIKKTNEMNQDGE